MSVVVTPAFFLFSSSRKLQAGTKNKLRASALANTQLSHMLGLPFTELDKLKYSPLSDCPLNFQGLQDLPKSFKTFLEISHVGTNPDKKRYLIRVVLEYNQPGRDVVGQFELRRIRLY